MRTNLAWQLFTINILLEELNETADAKSNLRYFTLRLKSFFMQLLRDDNEIEG